MTKWWHILATIGMAALAAAVPPLQAVIAGHAIISSILGVAWTVLGGLVQSPLSPQGK